VLEAGTIIAERYEIQSLVGEGGMGEVYEATHVHLGKVVALKILNKDFAKDFLKQAEEDGIITESQYQDLKKRLDACL